MACSAAAVMPMGSLIDSGEGISNRANLELICRPLQFPFADTGSARRLTQ
jgi:thiazole synthase ThiGH ThiG subunit